MRNKSKYAQWTDHTTLSHIYIHNKQLNESLKSREERCKHKIISRCVIEEETEELGEKPLLDPLSQNWSTWE